MANLEVISRWADPRALRFVDAQHLVITSLVDLNDGLSATVSADSGIKPRTLIRATDIDGKVYERRVHWVSSNRDRETIDIEAGGPIHDLSTCGLISEIRVGVYQTAFGGELHLSQWISEYILAKLAPLGLTWISPVIGPVEYDPLIRLTWDRWNPGKLLRSLSELSRNQEITLEQTSPGSLYSLGMVMERGSDLPVFGISRGAGEVRSVLDVSPEGLVTSVIPFASEGGEIDAPPTMHDHAWTVGWVDSNWVQLVDPQDSALSPVAMDDLLNGMYLCWYSGQSRVVREITDSNGDDGSVLLADSSDIYPGLTVWVGMDATGTPAVQLTNPIAYTDDIGFITEPISVSGTRPERNYLTNASFRDGSIGWRARNGDPSSLVSYPVSETAQIIGEVDGSVSPGAPSSISVKQFDPFSVIRTGEAMLIRPSPAYVEVSGNFVTSSSGRATVTLASPLTVDVPDGTPLFAPGVVDGNHTSGATSLSLRGMPINQAITQGSEVIYRRGGAYSLSLVQAPTTVTNGGGSAAWMPIDLLGHPMWNGMISGGSVPTQFSSPSWILPNGTALSVTGIGFQVRLRSSYSGGNTVAAEVLVPPGAHTFTPTNIAVERVEYHTTTITSATQDWDIAGERTITVAAAPPAGWGDSGFSDVVTNGPTYWTDMRIQSGGLTTTPTMRRVQAPFYIANGTRGFYPGSVIIASSTTSLDGSGEGTIPLRPYPTPLIPDGSEIAVLRNHMWPLSPVGSPTLMRSIGNGLISDPQVFEVSAGTARSILGAFLLHYYIPHPWQPFENIGLSLEVQVRDADTNQLLGSTITDDLIPIANDPAVGGASVLGLDARCLVSITQTRRLQLEVIPRKPSTVDWWQVHAMCAAGMLVPTSDINIPFFAGSGANALWHAATQYLISNSELSPSYTIDIDASGADMRRLSSNITVGRRMRNEDMGYVARIASVTRNLISGKMQVVLAKLALTTEKILAGGQAVHAGGTGSGTVVSPGGGSNGGSTTSSGVALVHPDASQLSDVRVLELVGLSAHSTGANRARLQVEPEIGGDKADVVFVGGDWIMRDLNVTGYEITVRAGSGRIASRSVVWPESTVTCPAENGMVYVDQSGTVRARPAGRPEVLPTDNELLLYRTYVDIPVYGNRIYSVADSRSYTRATPRAPLALVERVRACRITSGSWAGATATTEGGNINWYFSNLGLYPFVEELQDQVEAHLDAQVNAIYGATGTAETDWVSLHSVPWSNNFRWPFDVIDPMGTPVKVRADSHDSYAATFVRLAAKYARSSAAGLTWWDTNIAAIQDAIYNNLLIRQRFIGGGYLNETFQNPAIYPFCQTLDNMEVYRGLRDAFDMMLSRGGGQASWATTYGSTADSILSAIQTLWSDSPNANGDTGWLPVAWDNGASAALPNTLDHWYPNLTIGVPAAVFRVPLHSDPSIARTRLKTLFDHLNGKAPRWWDTRKFDLFPWGIVAASAAAVGFRDLAISWLAFVQRHHANDSPGYFQIQDIGWARYIERVLAGDDL